MVRQLALRACTAVAAVAALMPGLPSARASADPTVVFPGMEVHQDTHLCTLAYVDPVAKLAFTAGHCRGGGDVTDRDQHLIGRVAAFRDNTPSGSTVATDQVIADYEAIALTDNVTVSNILPGGRQLVSRPGVAAQPGQAVCHFGVITGETCGTVESVNNGWFTMSHGVQSGRGDSGGPIYVTPPGGPAQIVGIFNSIWGDLPAAVSWQSASEQIREDLGAQASAH
jgi:hypothetical protein